LQSIREELTAEITARLNDSENTLMAKFGDLSKRHVDANEAQRVEIRNQMSDFQSEAKREQARHEQSLERQITDFLSKQNVLVQNLTQRIDSYHDVSQALSAELSATTRKLDEFMAASSARDANSTRQLTVVADGLRDLKSFVRDLQAELAMQGQSVSTLGESLRSVENRLEETIQTLRGRSWFTGVK